MSPSRYASIALARNSEYLFFVLSISRCCFCRCSDSTVVPIRSRIASPGVISYISRPRSSYRFQSLTASSMKRTAAAYAL